MKTVWWSMAAAIFCWGEFLVSLGTGVYPVVAGCGAICMLGAATLFIETATGKHRL